MNDQIDPTPAAPSDADSVTSEQELSAGTDSPEQKEIAQLNDRLLRVAAEYDNFRRRAVKERHDSAREAARLAALFEETRRAA